MSSAGTGADPMCIATDVVVDGKQAVWIYSEFDTGGSLDDLVTWVEPDNWPSWGPQMFKEMKPLGERTAVPVDSGEQWSANYLEVVSLAGTQLRTVLRCDYRKADAWVAMTYDLDHSVGNVLQVDRGFLLAVDNGGRRQVKALKIVGFTDTVDNALATMVCPEWGLWMRQAVADAAKIADAERDISSGSRPSIGALGRGGGGAARASAQESATFFSSGIAEGWVGTVTDMAKFYGAYANDVGARLWSGEYKQSDLAEDSSRLFLRLAHDWSTVWRAGLETMQNLSEAEIPPTSGVAPVPGVPGRTIEFAVLLVPAQSSASRLAITDLVLMSPEDARLKASNITLKPVSLSPRDAPTPVEVSADTTGMPCGLYVGNLLVGESPDQKSVPAHLYASRARPAS